MSETVPDYNPGSIRSLLRDAFSVEELRRFCNDRTNLKPITNELGPNFGLEQTIDVVIDYCQKRMLMPNLLAEVRAYNPRQYERYEEDQYKYFEIL